MPEEKALEPDVERPRSPVSPPYSAFSPWQKRWILFLSALSGMFSPMSSFIFYPAITALASGIGVTVGLVNLAITTYMVVSGITPALLGNAADELGRRPIYILAFSIYFAANVGLALQNSYPALLVLRMVQSAGSSGTISLGYGIMSDIASPSERGFYVGLFSLGPNVAPPLGPVLGGVIAARLGWRWIFWFLVIFGGACLLLIILALPETARSIVANGSIPATGIYRMPLVFLFEGGKENIPHSTERKEVRKSIIPNPIACLRLLAQKDILIVLLCNGIYYATYCCVQASLSTLFIEIYGYQELQAGLIYIPFGLGCLLSVYIWGKILDYDYIRTAKSYGVTVNRGHDVNIDIFPIEVARLRSSVYLIVLSALGTISYGWVVQIQVHVSVVLVIQTIIGFAITGIFVALGTLLTDLNSNRSSTAAASANLIRCALAAGGLAALQPIIDAIGAGWCFTIFGLLTAACGPLLFLEMRLGHRWRKSRSLREASS
ncbi:major facilitator superfamily transporter [Biscogniauxia mediterranea]|nr:major facilitator superfamily transporter [Biscogniauxia mediterranea]